MTEQRVIARGVPASFRVGAARDSKDHKRSVLFRETPLEAFERIVLGTAWALRPRRIDRLAPLTRLWLADLLSGGSDLPEPDTLKESAELAGIARDLSVPTLLAAYRRGLFPHGHFGPTKWFTPAQRAVLLLGDFHIPTRLRAMMRQGKYTVTFDRDFEGVIKACAGRRQGRWHLTWITPAIMRAYARLYDEGHVHSFEVWNRDGELVGGGYGVVIGRVFVIESQFFRESNASKIGFSVFAWHLAKWGFEMCDNKWLTVTTAQMGFHEIPRTEYLRALARLAGQSARVARWEPEAGPKDVAEWGRQTTTA